VCLVPLIHVSPPFRDALCALPLSSTFPPRSVTLTFMIPIQYDATRGWPSMGLWHDFAADHKRSDGPCDGSVVPVIKR
jgi:hypothetical protein